MHRIFAHKRKKHGKLKIENSKNEALSFIFHPAFNLASTKKWEENFNCWFEFGIKSTSLDFIWIYKCRILSLKSPDCFFVVVVVVSVYICFVFCSYFRHHFHRMHKNSKFSNSLGVIIAKRSPFTGFSTALYERKKRHRSAFQFKTIKVNSFSSFAMREQVEFWNFFSCNFHVI